MVSFQTGASVAKSLFPALGPAGTAAARVGFAAIVMCALARPSVHRLRRPVIGRVAAYGVVLGAMNVSFYLALARLPLGLAVSIEFVGPLAVALAGSRRLADAGVFALVVLGLLLLLGPNARQAAPDPVGVLWALLAGLFWALYIVSGHRVGQVLPAAEGAALGMAFAALAVVPLAFGPLAALAAHPALLPAAFGVAMLSSAVPYTLEMIALRRMETRVFGVLMSLEPAVAALAGGVFLGEHLAARRWLGIACVVAASVASASRTRSTAEPRIDARAQRQAGGPSSPSSAASRARSAASSGAGTRGAAAPESAPRASSAPAPSASTGISQSTAVDGENGGASSTNRP